MGDLGSPLLMLNFNSWTQDANSTMVDLSGGEKRDRDLWRLNIDLAILPCVYQRNMKTGRNGKTRRNRKTRSNSKRNSQKNM